MGPKRVKLSGAENKKKKRRMEEVAKASAANFSHFHTYVIGPWKKKGKRMNFPGFGAKPRKLKQFRAI